jgi:hypothetical protein
MPQFSHGGIRDRPSQAAVAQHSINIELFHHNGAVISGEGRGQFVKSVAANVDSSRMGPL